MARWEPTFIVEFERNGKVYPITQEITSFEYDDSAEETNMLKLQIEDPLGKLLDNPDFLDDGHTKLRFRWGYIGDMSDMHEAILSYVKPSFPSGAPISLEVKAHDLGLFVQKGKQTKVWRRTEGYRPDEIAIAISGKLGLHPFVTPCDESTRRSTWTQGQLSDLEFLKKIAKYAVPANGQKGSNYVVFIRNNELHFEIKPTEAKAFFTYVYFPNGDSDLISFEPEIQEKKQSDTVERRGVKRTVKRDTSNTPRASLGKSDNTPGKKGNGSSSRKRGGGGGRHWIDAETGKHG